MYSHRSEYSDRRQYGGRSSRSWDDYDDRCEERRESHRDVLRDSYHKHGGDGCSSSRERTSRGREYSDSPNRAYNKDSLSREWRRKSPVRRRMSSPDWGVSEQKRRRLTEDDDDGYRYRYTHEDNTFKQSPDIFSHLHVPKDFKHTLPQDEDFKYQKTPKDSKHRRWHEEFMCRQKHDDFSLLSNCYQDSDSHERSLDHTQETQLQDHPTESYSRHRGRSDSPSTHHEDQQFPLNGSSEQCIESGVISQTNAVPGQKLTKGFQRFLDVLNKGVNVATLTKIVTQTSTEVSRPCSPVSAAYMWSPSSPGRQHQESNKNNCCWSESEGSQRLASPQQNHRSFSPKGHTLPDENLMQRSEGEQSFLSLHSRSRSPSLVDKITLTPEDDHKHRQIQGVLQAIGMDLGFEELGQMSHRIQERLYGKKDSDWGGRYKGSKEKDTRRAFSPRHQSRSSSSRSNFSPVAPDFEMKKDLYGAQRNEAEVSVAVEYGHNSSSSSLQDSEKSGTNSHKSTAALQTFSQNPTYSLSEPTLTPVMPTYSPLLTYPVVPPAPPSTLPQVIPGFFLPRLPPFFTCPPIPPLNILPGVLAQTGRLLPQHISNPQPPFFNLPDINTIQPLNTTQKSKTLSRPRCLQVIETKLPG
ncbi:cyclin-dependent kinase 12-like isoform X2 [Mastacembelus armatus]|uniref:cyclin-dependent kinase 12-like isoform X2 n=1 Tax=Mastacembelus armatus TaxID=205130 RepID=UPI000E460B96|nr:cyclin-dependent kinase 12-like isoform X2 [Mastacembelus armatus]